MKIITSLYDGHMKRFADYEAHNGLGFQGYERMLYLSLVAALARVAELATMVDDSEAEKLGYATELAKLKGDSGEVNE